VFYLKHEIKYMSPHCILFTSIHSSKMQEQNYLSSHQSQLY